MYIDIYVWVWKDLFVDLTTQNGDGAINHSMSLYLLIHASIELSVSRFRCQHITVGCIVQKRYLNLYLEQQEPGLCLVTEIWWFGGIWCMDNYVYKTESFTF